MFEFGKCVAKLDCHDGHVFGRETPASPNFAVTSVYSQLTVSCSGAGLNLQESTCCIDINGISNDGKEKGFM